MLDLERLKVAARAATPQNLDSAESADRYDDGRYIECPHCGGEGNVELEGDFLNYDGKALGVQFYGIGAEPGAAEAYLRAASPATLLELIERLERAESTSAPTSSADARYTMDEMRDYAEAFHRSRVEASAPTAPAQGEPVEWPSDRDAAIKACALMILGICKTEPQDVWPKRIEGRIRYMLSKIATQPDHAMVEERLAEVLKRLFSATVKYAQSPKGFNKMSNVAFMEAREIQREIHAFINAPAVAKEGMTEEQERAEFLAYWCEDVPEYMREKWKENVDECMKGGNATEKLSAAWDAWQARALLGAKGE